MDENFIPERIAQLRTQKGVSARSMSMKLGQTENYINNIENKKSLPSWESFFYICEYLEITPKDFFDVEAVNPALISELIAELKPLGSKALEYMICLVRELCEKK